MYNLWLSRRSPSSVDGKGDVALGVDISPSNCCTEDAACGTKQNVKYLLLEVPQNEKVGSCIFFVWPWVIRGVESSNGRVRSNFPGSARPEQKQYHLRHKLHDGTRNTKHILNMDLTKAMLKTICRDNGQYSSPALNDKLYLHYKVPSPTGLQRKHLQSFDGSIALVIVSFEI